MLLSSTLARTRDGSNDVFRGYGRRFPIRPHPRARLSSPRPITRRERIPTASGEERNRSSVHGVCHTNALASARPNRYARTESIRPRSLSSAHVLHLLVL